METNRPRVAIVLGSTRPRRICAEVGTWVREVLGPRGDSDGIDYELLDLAGVGLPLLDEPVMASLGHYEHEHTRRWSALVSSFDGFLFVFPQYNWGYPAALKNALDYLYAEWRDKPASVFTYGRRGGGKGAAQLLEVLQGLHMQVLPAHVQAPIPADAVDTDGQLLDAAGTLAPMGDELLRLHDLFGRALRV